MEETHRLTGLLPEKILLLLSRENKNARSREWSQRRKDTETPEEKCARLERHNENRTFAKKNGISKKKLRTAELVEKYPGWDSKDPHIRRQALNAYNRDIAKRPDIKAKRRELKRKYALANPEKVSQWARASRKRNIDKYKLSQLNDRINNPEKRIFYSAKSRARNLNLPFNIDIADIIIPDICPLLGIPIVSGIGGKNQVSGSPSLDRIVPCLGYVKGNVQVISSRANLIKNNSTLEEFTLMADNWKKLEAKRRG